MPVDLDDFWDSSIVNIVAQDLGELIIRRIYGPAREESIQQTAIAYGDLSLITISGKGIILGGCILTPQIPLGSGVIQSNSVPGLVIDGRGFGSYSFAQMLALGHTTAGILNFYLTEYDVSNYRYCAAISPGVTFESSLELWYHESHGLTPEVKALLLYALVL